MSAYVIAVRHRDRRVIVASNGATMTLEVATGDGLPDSQPARLTPMEAVRLAQALLAEVARATEFRS